MTFLLFTNLVIIIIVVLFLMKYKKFSSQEEEVVHHTVQFFIDSKTPYLKPEELEYLSSASTIYSYLKRSTKLIRPNSQKVNSLYITLLSGQLLKEIWRVRNLSLLRKYIRILYLSSIPRNEWIQSLQGHSSLYREDFGEWEQGQMIIDRL